MADAMSTSCLFCRIVAGDLPAEMLRTTEDLVAFRDINPAAPVHVLIVPREHLVAMSDLEERHATLLADVFQSATHLARAEGVDRSGWRLVCNEGDDAGQSVRHLHFHLLGGRGLGWPPG